MYVYIYIYIYTALQRAPLNKVTLTIKHLYRYDVCFLLGDSPGSEIYMPTPGNHPKESTQHSIHGESLKSRLPLQIVYNIS